MDAHNFRRLKRNFFNTAVADIPRAIEGGSIIGGYILTFCLIDCMGWIEYGDSAKSFNKWVKNRMGVSSDALSIWGDNRRG